MDDRIDTEQQLSFGLINDAFALGYHCWWILGFVLSFGLFVVVLSFVSGVLDNATFDTTADNENLQRLVMRNLQETDARSARQTIDRLTRLEGARRALDYPLSPKVRRDL